MNQTTERSAIATGKIKERVNAIGWFSMSFAPITAITIIRREIIMPENEEVRHVIYDCNEVVPLYREYGTKLIEVSKDAMRNSPVYSEQVLPTGCLDDDTGIAMVICHKDTGELIKNGMIIVLYKRVFYLAQNINRNELSFIITDTKGRIKVVR